MEQLSEGQIWAYFWTGSAFIFLILWFLVEFYYKTKNK